MANEPDKIQQGPGRDDAAWNALVAELGRDVERVADRLRGLSDARLAAPAPPYPSRAAAARATAQVLADAAAALEAVGEEPVWRELPELIDLSAGDQVAVTGHDLLAAAQSGVQGDLVWARDGRRTANEVLAEATAALAALRRLL
jgi:hypothetical protein